MPVKDQAAYMREYRARRKALMTDTPERRAKRLAEAGSIVATLTEEQLRTVMLKDVAYERIVFLEGEVTRLKRALAQANLDAILRKVNRRSE